MRLISREMQSVNRDAVARFCPAGAVSRRISMTKLMPKVDLEKCTRCGICAEACPCHAIELTEDGPIFHCPEVCAEAKICADSLWSCVCEDVCPVGAISCSYEIVPAVEIKT